ncbi:MAG: hypothetical protein WD847_10170 [Pirellulales bacterium]
MVGDRVEHHLRVLEILHYVLAAVTALAATVGVALLVVGYPMMHQTPQPGQPLPFSPYEDPQIVGMALVMAGIAVASLCLVHALAIAYIGCMIARRRRLGLCKAFSIFHLVNVPFGTALSIYALILLGWLKREQDAARPFTSRRSGEYDTSGAEKRGTPSI